MTVQRTTTRLTWAASIGGLLSIGALVYDHFDRISPLAIGLAAAILLGVIVQLILSSTDNQRLSELTRHEPTIDTLTGLGNRLKLVADLENRLAHDARAPTLLLMFDLSGFKTYNDNFGHAAGDALLIRLAEKLASVVGPEGVSYRLGGDELCLITPVDEATRRD